MADTNKDQEDQTTEDQNEEPVEESEVSADSDVSENSEKVEETAEERIEDELDEDRVEEKVEESEASDDVDDVEEETAAEPQEEYEIEEDKQDATVEEETKEEEKEEAHPDFGPGDTVKVHYKIVEGDKTRVQPFEGIVISKKGEGNSKTFMVRRIGAGNIGVERIFPLYSPNIHKIDVLKRGKVRRAKLYYLRDKKGRAATKVKEAK